MDGIEADGGGRQAVETGKRIRRQWTARQKRQMVREARRPGALMQEVARRHGVHVSVLTRWRKEERAAASVAKKAVNTVRLLPVRVRRVRPSRAPRQAVPVTIATSTQRDAIEVEFSAGRRLTVSGIVDGATLRTVLQELSQC
jgi:transposase